MCCMYNTNYNNDNCNFCSSPKLEIKATYVQMIRGFQVRTLLHLVSSVVEILLCTLAQQISRGTPHTRIPNLTSL
jgi:hypothetical protein